MLIRRQFPSLGGGFGQKNRPAKSPACVANNCSRIARCALGDALDHEGRGRRPLRREAVSFLKVVQRRLELRLIVVVDHHQRLALLHLRAHLLDLGDADRVIDLAFWSFATRAEQVHAARDHRRVDRVHVATLRGGQLTDVLGHGEFLRVIDVRRVAALGLHEVFELFQRRTIREVALHRLLSREGRARDAGETNYLHAQLQHEFLHVLGPFALEELDRLLQFQRGADRVAKRLVHVGHKRDATTLHRATHAGHRARELLGLLEILDEGTVAPLHVDHESFGALCEFAREDRTGDQGQARDRARRLARFKKLGVGRGELLVLFHDRAADLAELRGELRDRKLRLKTGHRSQFLQRVHDVVALRVTHHRHDHSARHRQGHEHKRRLVAHAAGRVFVDLRLRDVREIDHLAGKHHLLGKLGRFLGRHLLEVDGHQQSRELVLGQIAIKRAVDNEADFLLGELAPVALFLNQELESRLNKAACRNSAFRHVGVV